MSWRLIHRNGKVHQAELSLLSKSDVVELKKSDGWSRGFNWSEYLAKTSEFSAYKLHITGKLSIQGLIAIAVRDGFVEVDLIEKAPMNRKPKNEYIMSASSCLGLRA